MVELNHKRYQNKQAMSAKAVIHINGHDFDAASGEKIHTDALEAVEPKHHSGVVHSPKPPLAHHVPHKSTTLLRHSVKKPRILNDIRHTPIEGTLAPTPKTPPVHTRTRQSPKVMHFSKIEPRMIDISTPDPILAFPDSPPPIAHHHIRHSKAESHVRRQLAAATSHLAKPHKRHLSRSTKRRRASTLVSGIAVLVLITGFVAYQSLAGLSLNMASRQAGFSAALPKYTPGGFKLEGPVQYGQGRVVLSFQSNTDDRSYKIEQKPSLLTDSELKDQVAESTNGKYQSVKSDGQEIFISGGTATWSKDGVLYSLKGESGLSSTQIASIATSL